MFVCMFLLSDLYQTGGTSALCVRVCVCCGIRVSLDLLSLFPLYMFRGKAVYMRERSGRSPPCPRRTPWRWGAHPSWPLPWSLSSPGLAGPAVIIIYCHVRSISIVWFADRETRRPPVQRAHAPRTYHVFLGLIGRALRCAWC